ncbi:MAG: asparaginase [Planctomycetaceae bacterium]|nr:asparaginase [Planctomycetaceae bacterium]
MLPASSAGDRDRAGGGVVKTGSRIALITTGGTIEKTYDELGGVLTNRVSNLDVMLAQLELGGIELSRVGLMNKDSLDLTEADLELIIATVAHYVRDHDGVVVVHGTDRLAETGRLLDQRLSGLRVPVVMTGAMRPYELRHTDATQNLTEAMLAVQVLEAGVWCVMHNRALRFPEVVKDRSRMTFVTEAELTESR